MEFHDPDHERSEAVEIGIERSPRDRSGTIGWAMVAAGVVGYVVMQLVHAVRYEFTDMFNALFGLGFLLTTVVATAGVFVIVVQRWLLPELVTAIEASLDRERDALPAQELDDS